MSSIAASATRFLNEQILTNPQRALSEQRRVDAQLSSLNILYGEKPMPTFLSPLFFDESIHNVAQSAIRRVDSALEKLVGLFGTPEYGPYFPVLPREMPLMEEKNRFERSVILARYDAFIGDDGSVKFLEFNTDSPGGMAYMDHIGEIMEHSTAYQLTRERWYLSRHSMMKKFARYLSLKCLREGFEKPYRMAIVDFREVVTGPEFVLLKKYFEGTGNFDVTICDPAELTYDGTELAHDGKPIDLVLRRSLTAELAKADPGRVGDFVDAVLSGAVVSINPFRCKLAGCKSLMALFFDPRTQKLFSLEEKAAIENHVPFTCFFSRAETIYKGERVDMHELAREERDNMVLKPVSGYGGKDVLIGRHTMPTVWDRTLRDTRDGEYVLQEFVDIPTVSLPVFDRKGRLECEDKYCNLNFYVLDGELVGTLGRLSDSPVVNIAQGGGMTGVFSVKQVIWSYGSTGPVGDETDPQ